MKKLIIIIAFLLIPLTLFAETWEMAICPADREDLASGHKRAKKGDIVAIKPYPWEWGRIEKQNYLIVIVNNLTEEEAMQMMQPYYKNDVEPTMKKPAEVTEKRKFKIDLDTLKTEVEPLLDLSKVGDQVLKGKGTQISIDTLETYDIFQNKHDLKWRKGKKSK